MRARTWVFVLVGAILFGFASLVFTMTLDPDGWTGLTMRELAIWSLLIGGSVGAVIGLLVHRMMLAPRRHQSLLVTLLTLVGAIFGVVLTLAFGECSTFDNEIESPCAFGFLAWRLSPGTAVALSAALGGLGGALFGLLLGLVAGFRFLRRESAV